MKFWQKSPSSGAARHLLPDGEKKGFAHASYTSTHRGEVNRHSRVGEGDFSAQSSPIWNDIQRALEGAGK
jgi:hypothetical protein